MVLKHELLETAKQREKPFTKPFLITNGNIQINALNKVKLKRNNILSRDKGRVVVSGRRFTAPVHFKDQYELMLQPDTCAAVPV